MQKYACMVRLVLRRGATEGALVPHLHDALHSRQRAQLGNAIGWGENKHGVEHILDRSGDGKSPALELVPQRGLSRSDFLPLIFKIGG